MFKLLVPFQIVFTSLLFIYSSSQLHAMGDKPVPPPGNQPKATPAAMEEDFRRQIEAPTSNGAELDPEADIYEPEITPEGVEQSPEAEYDAPAEWFEFDAPAEADIYGPEITPEAEADIYGPEITPEPEADIYRPEAEVSPPELPPELPPEPPPEHY